MTTTSTPTSLSHRSSTSVCCLSQVLLAELKGTQQYYAVKALKKDVVLEDDDIEGYLVERRVMQLGISHPFITHLHSTFQSPVSAAAADPA